MNFTGFFESHSLFRKSHFGYVKEGLQSDLRISSAHNKGGLPFFELLLN